MKKRSHASYVAAGKKAARKRTHASFVAAGKKGATTRKRNSKKR
jgi:hypothetical protein